MAEIKCPMCSKSNPADAEVCEFCGARLTPLVADDGDVESGGSQPAEDESVPGWLARIRERAEEELPEEEPPSSGPDWLSRLRSAETEEPGPPEDEIPDWLAEEGDESEPGEDWLGRLRASTEDVDESSEGALEEEEDEEVEAAPSSDELAQRMGEQRHAPEPPEQEAEEASSGFSGGLASMGGSTEPEEEPSEWEPLAEEEGDQPDLNEEPLAESEAPEAGIDSEEPKPEPAEFEFDQAEQASAFEAGSVELPTEQEEPGWFDEFERALDEDLPDWLPSEEEQPAEEAPPAADLELEEPVDEAMEEEPAAEEAEEAETAEAAWESFDWDDFELTAEEPEPAPPEAAEPAEPPEQAPFPEDAGAQGGSELPHVPALIIGEGGERVGDIDVDAFDLDAIELPDWLSEVQEAGEGPQPAVQEDETGNLAPATIPSWLEAMRPVETFQPVVDLGSEEEQSVETVGPLAGLRGVLLAEPVVAKPHTATSSGQRLQVTERQYAQAELLRRIVEQEDQETGAVRTQGRRFPFVRWLISAALVVAVLLPPLLGFPHFDTPERVSRDLGPLIQVVSNVPADRPALVVFDYEPGYSAELSGVAGALLENLMARGVSVVTLSTRPTGPPLALDLLNEIGAPHNIENGRNYVHLGYLSGGPTAVQLFSAAPKAAILKGFMLPTDLEARTPWDLPVLRNVNALSDFGMVAVVAAGTDTARTWAEQASPFMGDRPLVMVLSAGAEPLIRPYFESRDPQVDGILAGLPAAVAYEQINGRPGQALSRWDAFGAGTLAVELILLAGLAYGVGGWVISLRREETEE